MSKPKAFISSTIYDLRAERNIISKILESRGFETYMSEYGGKFPIEPFAKSTYETCVIKVKECNLFILYLGKRLGSSRKFKWEDTIVYQEFNSAIDPSLGIPIYIFVDKELDNLRKAYKKDKSKDKESFKKLHNDIDSRIYEFIETFADLIDNDGEKQKNFWYFPIDTLDELEEILNFQLDNLMLSALKTYSLSSGLKNSPYQLIPKSIKSEGDDTFMLLELLNRGPSDIYNVNVELYCRIKSDLRYWHKVPKNGIGYAPLMSAKIGNWFWTFILSKVKTDPHNKGISTRFNENLMKIFKGTLIHFEDNYFVEDMTKLKKVSISKEDISFVVIISFTELLSGKLRVERKNISVEEIIKLSLLTK